ncbi:mitochondrial fission ELM1 family protein [Methylohalobius crimeensis]|uniref:mitochondrial fission ELM1 family protein n=1 Tax=Methylohalobius crimeensis TaxID=244365 RepID=UPI0003B68D00|nr:mitochondrial fission ELM1 family protein [Methylohalobius crimeensis]
MWFMLHHWIGRQTCVAPTAPRVWALLNHRAGENAQVLALAEALNWPFEIKQFTYRKYVPYLLVGASLSGIHEEQSDSLAAPWPDLIISASARNEPICRWVQRQAAKAGKRVRLVHIGRPWNRLSRFDLVITTPQYRLPRRANVLHNGTTLHRVTRNRLAREAKRWQPRLAHLRRPVIAVMIGGSSGPYLMDQAAARQLATQVDKLARELNGALLVTTSARTPPDILETFAASITAPAHLFRWSPDSRENPYYGYLALADQIVVTSDSVSMLTESCATGKPVHIFDLGKVARCWQDVSWNRLRASIYRWAMHGAPKRLTRDISRVHERMIAERRAVWLGQPFPVGPIPDFSTDMCRAVSRVRSLFVEESRTLKASRSESLNPVFS